MLKTKYMYAVNVRMFHVFVMKGVVLATYVNCRLWFLLYHRQAECTDVHVV